MARRARRCNRSVARTSTGCASCSGTRSSPSLPDATALLRDIAAAPRPTGGNAIAAARERCAHELRAMGYEVREKPFEFSEFPGRFATPLLGGSAAALVGTAGRLGAEGTRFVPLVILTLGGVSLYVAARWLARRGVVTAPVLRARGVNIEATHPAASTTLWLCAHLDTKSQPIPTLVRTTGVVLLGVGYLSTLVLATAASAGHPPYGVLWGLAALVTLLGAIPVVLSIVGRSSPGALDNASGVATVIAAAQQLADRSDVGVLLTDAEELGLAGARAWARERKGETVLNCDGVDDRGINVVMFTGSRPERLIAAAARASGKTGIAHECARMVPGVLTDSVAFSDAGLASITFSRGNWRSLARVHSRRDDLKHLRGAGIADAAALIAATARDLGEMT